jgi:hypothetical protein
MLMITWLAIAWLACCAVMLVLFERAPEMSD